MTHARDVWAMWAAGERPLISTNYFRRTDENPLLPLCAKFLSGA